MPSTIYARVKFKYFKYHKTIGADGTLYFGYSVSKLTYIQALNSDGTSKWSQKITSTTFVNMITSPIIGSKNCSTGGCDREVLYFHQYLHDRLVTELIVQLLTDLEKFHRQDDN